MHSLGLICSFHAVYGLLGNHQGLPSLTLMTAGMHKMPFVNWMVLNNYGCLFIVLFSVESLPFPVRLCTSNLCSFLIVGCSFVKNVDVALLNYYM
jgi:hypothetical protein